MPEQPAWRFQKLIRPMFNLPTGHLVLKGRVLTCVGDQVIEDGFVAARPILDRPMHR